MLLHFTLEMIIIFVKSGSKAQDSSILEAGQTFTTDSTAIILKELNIGYSPKFTFEMLANATNQFHVDNLLGRGGFGPVYKVTKPLTVQCTQFCINRQS